MNRRNFLLGTAAAAAWPAMQSHTLGLPARATAAAQGKRLFELGTVTYNLGQGWTLDQLIEICEKAEFKAVELRTTHSHGVEPHLSSARRQEVRRRFETTPVKLICLGTTCEFHSPDPEVVRKNIDEAKTFLELASDVGAMGIKVRPNGLPEEVPIETTLKQIGRALQEVGQSAETFGVEVWVEVHGRRSSHPPYMKKMMDYCAHPMVGVTWNSNAADIKDGSVRPYFELLQSHIRNVHIHELYAEYPWAELFALLKGMGYDRWTLAEIPEAEGDALRFMRYYRGLWNELSSPAQCT